MDGMPEEIMELIFSYLSPYKEYGVAACVCRRWHRIIEGMTKQLPCKFEQDLINAKIEWFGVAEGAQTTTLSPRTGQAVCYCDFTRSMYIFGGKSLFSSGAGFNDLLRLDMHSLLWQRPVVKGNIPTPKFGCSLDSYKHYLILFGGSYLPPSNTLHRGATEYSNDLHVYNVQSNEWKHKPFLSHECPAEIYMPKTCVISGHDDDELDVMLMYGGHFSSANLNTELNKDVWCLHLTTWIWVKQTLIGESSSEAFDLSKLTFNHLESTTYSSSVLALGLCPASKLPQVWLICRTGAAEWTVQSLVLSTDNPMLFSNINFHMPSLILGKTLIIFRSICSEQILPNFDTIMQPKYVRPKVDSLTKLNSSKNTTLTNNAVTTGTGSSSFVRSKIYMFLFDLSVVEYDGLVKCVSQLDSSGKLLPSFVGVGVASNVTAVMGRGEIILQSVVKSGKRSYMSLSLVRSAK